LTLREIMITSFLQSEFWLSQGRMIKSFLDRILPSENNTVVGFSGSFSP